MAEAEAVIVTNDSATPQPLSDEPAAGMRQAYRAPVRAATLAATTVPATTAVVTGDADAAAGGLDDGSGRLPLPSATPPLKPRKAWSPPATVQQAEVPVVAKAEAVTSHNKAAKS